MESGAKATYCCLTTLRVCCRACGGAAQSSPSIISRAAPTCLRPASSKRLLGRVLKGDSGLPVGSFGALVGRDLSRVEELLRP
jgi:hypothetical protein